MNALVLIKVLTCLKATDFWQVDCAFWVSLGIHFCWVETDLCPSYVHLPFTAKEAFTNAKVLNPCRASELLVGGKKPH